MHIHVPLVLWIKCQASRFKNTLDWWHAEPATMQRGSKIGYINNYGTDLMGWWLFTSSLCGRWWTFESFDNMFSPFSMIRLSLSRVAFASLTAEFKDIKWLCTILFCGDRAQTCAANSIIGCRWHLVYSSYDETMPVWTHSSLQWSAIQRDSLDELPQNTRPLRFQCIMQESETSWHWLRTGFKLTW